MQKEIEYITDNLAGFLLCHHFSRVETSRYSGLEKSVTNEVLITFSRRALRPKRCLHRNGRACRKRRATAD